MSVCTTKGEEDPLFEGASSSPQSDFLDRNFSKTNAMSGSTSPDRSKDSVNLQPKRGKWFRRGIHRPPRISGSLDNISRKLKLKLFRRMTSVRNDGALDFEIPSGNRHLSSKCIDDCSNSCGERNLDIPERDGTEFVPPLQIVMLIVGTRGDVQPFLAIGKCLLEYGHRVRLATHENFEELVLSTGLEFYKLGGDPKVLAEYMVKNKGFLPSSPSEISIQRKHIKDIIYSLHPACTEADVASGIPFKVDAIIANPPAYGHTLVAEYLDVPIHIFFTMPWTKRGDAYQCSRHPEISLLGREAEVKKKRK